ncbi:MAG TPA: 7,8-didemethyl-8-hydroxy-5-deazariboflavin synthase CofG [Candidatus Acidoferrales bacterium]|nr:7,8-didemethyl-8-hydroxy-5-deazariboflavin synthase CofG [Candidatus Acidoferrales bacterium]
MEDILARATQQRDLARAEALLLYGAELPALLSAATSLRDRCHGRRVTFSKKVFIPLTPLCRDYCGYCTFRRDPSEPGGRFLTPDEVLDLAQRARRAGCKEALFSLGDQPERVFPEAAEQLRQLGFARTLDYLVAMCELTLERTNLLPHANPGLMGKSDLERLRRSNVSVGLMLESTSTRLMRKGEVHWNAPDKVPSLRLRTIEEAGRLRMAFTTGMLIGIGETLEERVECLFAIRELHARYGHVQEVIVQNFRAKPGTPWELMPEPSLEDMLRTLAIARLILGGRMNLQAPPNLSYADFPRLLEGGINDWGGISPVTQDFINPEAPWPDLALLKHETETRGYELRERLAIYPEFARQAEFVDPKLRFQLGQWLDTEGYARSCAN